MGNIPLVTSQRTAQLGAPNSYNQNRASPDAFGAGIGRAVQGLAAQIADTVNAVDQVQRERKDKTRAERIAFANANTDLTTPALQARLEGPADGSGVTRTAFEAQRAEIDRMADEYFPDDEAARTQFKAQQYGKLGSWRDQNVQYEFSQATQFSRDETNRSVDALINRARTDFGAYDTVVADGEQLIDVSTAVPQSLKAGMKASFRNSVAAARFDAAIGNADTREEFDSIRASLNEEKWQGEMDASTYDRTITAVETARKQFVSGQDAQARSLLESMEARSKAEEIIPDEELRELADLARSTGSPAITNRYARLIDQQATNRRHQDSSPAQIRQEARTIRGQATQGEPGRWANDASSFVGGAVSPAYLLGMLDREYSAADIAAGRFDVKNKAGASSAMGVGQFIAGTWLQVVKPNAERLGLDLSGKTDADILAMRGDPEIAMKATAIYAAQNARKIRADLGIEPGDTELYLGHFLGGAGAVAYLRAMRSDPDAAANPSGAFTQAQIDANKAVFFKRDGTARTYREVYENIASSFTPGTNAVQFDRAQHLDRLAGERERLVRDDPMTAYGNTSRYVPYALENAQDFARRGRDAMSAANFYDIPTADMKPFTAQEAQQLTKQLQEGNADQKLAIMAQLQEMERVAPGMARAAYKQLGEEDSVLEHAARLAYSVGDVATASQVVRGQTRIRDDKTITEAMGSYVDQNDAFNRVVGTSMRGITPAARQSLREAAAAHYAETHVSAGNMNFDPRRFERSVQAVIGGTGIDLVNGEPTLLPKGLDGPTFDAAIQRMTDAELVEMSDTQVPPRDIEGYPITADDVRSEGKLRAIGDDEYEIEMADGGILTTGEVDPSNPYRMRSFIFIPDVDRIKEIAARDRFPDETRPTTILESPATQTFGAPQDGFDESGMPVGDPPFTPPITPPEDGFDDNTGMPLGVP